MTRLLLQYVLPLLLPVALYAGWVMFMRQRGRTAEDALAQLRQGPWFWLVLAGFALMASGLAYVALTTGSDPESTYRPPSYEGGEVKPGGFDRRPD